MLCQPKWIKVPLTETGTQRVLNDFWRARLSRGRMIWLQAPAHPLRQVRPAKHRKTEKERQLADGRRRGEGGGRGTESYDCKKAWSSINHSILSYRYLLNNLLPREASNLSPSFPCWVSCSETHPEGKLFYYYYLLF
jgi:hypothetical protein